MRVALAPTPPPARAAYRASAAPLLDPGGARVVLGSAPATGAAAAPVAPAANALFGPRGACLGGRRGPLFVCDTGHHRLLVWRRAPAEDGAPADFVIGQPDLRTEGRNGKGSTGPATLNVPAGVAFASGVLAVADAWNHRVLLWHGPPQRDNEPADVVLGQADFDSGEPNRGLDAPRADTLNWCYGVAIHDGRLIVADTGNRRVLVWDGLPVSHGAPADLVLGQRVFTTRDDSAAAAPGAAGMRWPHGVTTAHGRFFVADAGLSRVMAWDDLPRRNGAACDHVLGQDDFAGCDHNRGAYHPTAASLNMPYGVAALRGRLVAADTANSRLVGFDLARLETGAPAAALAGQPGFDGKGDNRWQGASRDSLCWPYGVAAVEDTLVVADSGNNRVLLWDAA